MSYRPARLAHELRNFISEIISRELQDPRVGFATITDVKVSRDMKHVTVFVSVFETDRAKQATTVTALNHASGFIRRAVFSRFRLRHSPEIVFSLDESVERGDRMSRLLDQISRDLPPVVPDESSVATPVEDQAEANHQPILHEPEPDEQQPRLVDQDQTENG